MKDFDNWNKNKKEMEKLYNYLPFYKERQIRWCRLGLNVGYEQDGTNKEFSRPVLIVKGFSRHVCLIIPLTTSSKKNPYHVSLGNIDGKNAYVVISQVRLIDTRRLDELIETLNKEKYQKIRKAIKDLL